MRFLRARMFFGAVPFLLSLAWCAVVVAGFYLLERYKTTPGEQSPVRGQWPQDSHIERIPGTYNLVMALHPRCPCSQASVAELERVLAGARADVRVHVLVYQPSSSAGDAEWRDTGLCRRVKRIPRISLHPDADAAEAERFGARTSGQVVLYGPDGDLLFHGGVTSARGHEGESAAHQVLWSLLRGERSQQLTTPVFGCPLRAQIVSRCNNEK
jgi:hypothetical protein